MKEGLDASSVADTEELELECELPIGHTGPHRTRTPTGSVLWFPRSEGGGL